MSESVVVEYRPYEAQHDPYPFYARARQEHPVFYSPDLGSWVVTRYRDVREVLGNPDTYSLATVLRSLDELVPEAIEEIRSATPPLPEDHAEPGDEARKRAREPIQRAFGKDRVAELESYLQDRVATLVEEFVAGGPGDLMSRLARRLPVHAKAKVLGLEAGDIEAVVDGSYSLTYLMSGARSIPAEEQIAYARRVATYQRLLDRYAQDRRSTPTGDLFSEVVAAVAPGSAPLTAVERKTVVESMAGLIGAGQSTSTAVIGTAVWHLTRHPHQWRLLRQVPDLAANAVEEILRYDMPLQGLLRVTTRPVELGGQQLPEGALLMVMFASANRDEEQFERPDELDITRSPRRHFSFGYGPRACVGLHLARRMLQITLVRLATRLPDLRCAGEDAATLVPGLHRILRRLDVTWST